MTKLQVMGNDGENAFASTEEDFSGFYFDNNLATIVRCYPDLL